MSPVTFFARLTAIVLLLTAVSGCDRVQDVLHAQSRKWSAPGVAETKRRGDIICRAIEAYRAKTGKYPASLGNLQPAYLREIPQPTVGDKRWEYMLTDQGTNYWLHVFASEFGPSLEKNAGSRWQYTDDDGQRDL